MRLFEIYYFVKYLPLRLWKCRAPMERKGFVGVQIDGLAHDDLVYALEHGYAPRLARSLRDRRFRLAPYPAGLPSATSYAQMGIFYGENDNVPAFRWYERRDRRVVNCNRPHSVEYLRTSVGDRPGILRGGSSYANLIDGDAERSVLTANSSQPRSFFEELGGVRFLLLMLLHPVRLLMTLLASVVEILLELHDRYVSRRVERHPATEGWFPVVRALGNVVLRELQTIAVMADIYAGVPYIFTTYLSYDELAHHYGPRARPALKNLSYILGRVHEIEKMVRRLPGRHYDLVILSDHGQTAGRSFLADYGATLGQVLHRHFESRVHSEGGERMPTSAKVRDLYALHMERRAGQRGLVVRRLLRWVARLLRAATSVETYLPEKYFVDAENDVVVTYSGALALVYFSQFDERLDDAAVLREFPDVLEFLVGHSGVGLVVTQAAGGGVVLRSDRGVARLAGGELTVVAGEDPLAPYEAGAIARRALERMGRWANTGDLILFGRYADGEIVCFDDQVSSHGCLGGAQFWPFLLLPNDPRFEGLAVTDPRDLYYLVFEPYHRGERQDVTRDA